MSVLDYSSPEAENHALLKTPWVIKDCHSVTEYISSPDHFETIEHSPLVYYYDECEVILRSLDQGEISIRFEAIHGGNMPSVIGKCALNSPRQLLDSFNYIITPLIMNRVQDYSVLIFNETHFSHV